LRDDEGSRQRQKIFGTEFASKVEVEALKKFPPNEIGTKNVWVKPNQHLHSKVVY
jgi:hypothetical protein